MDNLWHDLRFTLRALARAPGFAAVAVVTLALGIGANSAIFSVIDAVLLTPLPYADPERLVMLRERSAASPGIPVSAEEFLRLRDAGETLEAVAAFDMVDFHVPGDDGPERLEGARVSANFFPMLGVAPLIGRGFSDDEERPGHNRSVLLSYRLWQRRFGGDPGVLGRELRMFWNASFGPSRDLGDVFTVVGVLPPSFEGPMGERDLWVPLALSAEIVQGGAHFLFPFGRLKPGADLAAAAGELSGILGSMERPADQAAAHRGDVGVSVVALAERAVRDVRPALLVLAAAVGLVLLVASANVAQLLLARASTRRREIAVRLALGASTARLVRQLLVESLVLASLGGGLGLGLAWAGVAALRAFDPGNLPRVDAVAIDLRVLAFTLAVALVTAVLFGLVPALRAARPRLQDALRAGTGGELAGGARLRDALVVVEVALAVVLLVGAGLLLRSFHRLSAVDPGFTAERVLSFRLALPALRYPELEDRQAFFERAWARLDALPGVDAALVNTLPFSFLNTASLLEIEGRPHDDETLLVDSRQVSAGFFEVLGVPLLRGESFRPEDVRNSPTVVVIDRAMAERYFAGDDPLGQRLALPSFGLEGLRIVGVVGDVLQSGYDRAPRPTVYLPNLTPRTASVVLRTFLDPEAAAAAARQAIRELDPELPIYELRPLAELGDRMLARPRFNAWLLALFAALALALAAVGIYGVLSFSVSRRTRELGLRRALGARRGDVLRLVVRQGLVRVTAGLALGLAASLGLTRLAAGLLFGVGATDPATYAVIALGLMTVGLAAVWLPARRATRIEPVTALRYE